MSAFESELQKRLREWEEQTLFRRLRRVSSPQGTCLTIEGRECINFSSNDYLGLATHPALKAAAIEAVERWGAGSGASRLISGSLLPHYQLEEALAEFKITEAALTFSTGYATAVGTITALVGKGDIIVLDKLVHASIVDAARLSGATLRIFRHNDLNDLADVLHWAEANRRGGQVLVVTESLFCMDGDVGPLKEIVELKEKHGAWLMIDEAHATGIFGEHLRGLAEEAGVSERVEIQMGTLGKALGAAGGYIAGSRALVDYLVNKARSFIFSTAPPPAVSAAATVALGLLRSPEGTLLRQKLRTNIGLLRQFIPAGSVPGSPILPWIVGEEERALRVAEALRDADIFAPAIRYPSVARGKARLRFTVSSAHTEFEIERAGKVIRSIAV